MKKARLDGDRVDGDAPTTSIPACGHRRFDMCQVSASCTPVPIITFIAMVV